MKRFNALLLSIFFFIVLYTPVILGSPQTINQSKYNDSYKVHVGDTTRYDYTKVLINKKNYLSTSDHLSNGTNVPINITKGDYFTIEVTRIDNSSTRATTIYVNKVLYLAHYEPLQTNNTPAYSVIRPGFDNYTAAVSYYNQTTLYNFSRHGDVIELSRNYQYNSNSNLTVSLSTEYNWKTGWIEKGSQELYYTNGTIITYFVYQRHSDSQISSIAKVSTNILELVFIIILIAIPVIIGMSYRSYSQQVKISGKSKSFPQYIQSKTTNSKNYAKKRSNKEVHSTNKALETIESILEETGSQNK